MKKYLLFLILCTALLAGCADNNHIQTIEYEDVKQAETVSAEEVSAPEDICVSILGEVMEPGIYILPKGSRVYEVINLAGGMTEEADANSINLAAVLADEMQIVVPSVLDGEEIANSELIGMDNQTGKVNINTASLSELMTLTGIGEVRAQAIIDYREKSGKFKCPEDIMNVSGIKQNSYDKIKDEIYVK